MPTIVIPRQCATANGLCVYKEALAPFGIEWEGRCSRLPVNPEKERVFPPAEFCSSPACVVDGAAGPYPTARAFHLAHSS